MHLTAFVQFACVIHVSSVHSEPGSNPLQYIKIIVEIVIMYSKSRTIFFDLYTFTMLNTTIKTRPILYEVLLSYSITFSEEPY